IQWGEADRSISPMATGVARSLHGLRQRARRDPVRCHLRRLARAASIPRREAGLLVATVARTQTLDVPRPRVRLRISRVVFLVLAVIVTAVALAPFVLTVSGSFK